MNKIRCLAVALLVLTGHYATAQTLTNWGVSATSVYADCTLTWCSDADLFPLGLMIPQTHATDPLGGLGAASASLFSEPDIWHDTINGPTNMGGAAAEVILDPILVGVPELRARAASYTWDGWVSALAFGIQAYQYSGSGADITLNATFSGDIVNPNLNDVTGFSVGVWLLKPDASATLPDATTFDQFVANAFDETTAVEAKWTIDENGLTLIDGTGAVKLNSGPLTISLSDGDEFYLAAGLVAESFGAGQSAVSWSTLTMSFDNPGGLAPTGGVAAVPEPETYAMMLVGIGLVGWQLQRKSRRSRAHRLG